MADKELRKLNRRELLKMLLVQCEETERLQQESDEIREQFGTLAESYERLKKKLDLKDARLNAKDAQIAELKQQIEDMKKSKAIELEETGSIAEAAIRINGVFEAAQRAAEQYLMNVRELSEREAAKESGKKKLRAHTAVKAEENQIPFEPGRISGIRKKSGPPRTRQVVPMSLNQMSNGSSQNKTPADGAEELKLAAASGDIHG
ncbi:MAG: hypothetical protein K1W22_11220 [Lachnospiraceae bacterium]